MNTRFEYMYRDGDNYKKYAAFILQGTITKEQFEEHIDKKMDGFIPEQVGLPGLQESWNTDVDGPWHELWSAEWVHQAPNYHLTAEQLLHLFIKANSDGWDEDLCEAAPPPTENEMTCDVSFEDIHTFGISEAFRNLTEETRALLESCTVNRIRAARFDPQLDTAQPVQVLRIGNGQKRVRMFYEMVRPPIHDPQLEDVTSFLVRAARLIQEKEGCFFTIGTGHLFLSGQDFRLIGGMLTEAPASFPVQTAEDVWIKQAKEGGDLGLTS